MTGEKAPKDQSSTGIRRIVIFNFNYVRSLGLKLARPSVRVYCRHTSRHLFIPVGQRRSCFLCSPMSPKHCPNVLSQGTCNDPACNYEHNILVCEPCSFIAVSVAAYHGHLSGRRHRSRIAGRNVKLFCPICEENVMGGNWQSHISGKRHHNQSAAKGTSPVVEPHEATAINGERYCYTCKLGIEERRWNRHLQSPKHKKREAFTSYRAALDEAEKEKNGIIVEGDLDFGFIDPAQTTGEARRNITLKTNTPNLRVRLLSLGLVSTRGISNTAFTVTLVGDNRDINTRSSVKLIVALSQMHIGRYEDRLELTFEDIQLRKTFLISRPVRAIVGNQQDHEQLKAKAPYIPRPRTERKKERSITEGEEPPSLKIIPYVDRLPKAPIPQNLLSILSERSTKDIVDGLRRAYLPTELNADTYARYFKTLIWIEEHRTEEDLERFDIHDARLKRNETYYFVEVLGLAEKRPSVLKGDRILVQKHGETQDHWFEGFVHVLNKAEVGLRFDRRGSFNKQWSENQLFHVRFKLNRIPFRRQHQALDTAFQEDRVLFPTVQHAILVPRVRWTSTIIPRFHSRVIATNPQQVQAVTSIAKLPPGSPTFIIFGPFGTGKTSTMIEAMLQVLDLNARARILACAPSNSAADLIVTRLSGELDNEKMFRFMAPSRYKDQVPDDVRPYTYLKDAIHFGVPISRIKHFKVVVSTCVSASFAAGIGLPRGHFTHIFIDEAGHATEPEAFIGIKRLADPATNIILGGDPKQLGPIIRSPVARELGLQRSYLERLMERDAYNINTYSGATVVKLLQNYRSHPSILKFPNQQFYHGELEVRADVGKINKYIGCSLLPNKKFPIIFHAVYGKDDREATSPSFFNADEVLQVKQYVQALRDERRYRTTDGDIGIISPYHAQCCKIRTALKSVADGIKVGSVEEFQGQERPVIIISTVRSSKEYVEFDLRHTLGFVANPRRFNVAVTRTQALLIIVGDPQVLSLDPLWRSFLNYVFNNGGWKGPQPDWDTNAEVNLEGGYDAAVRSRAQLDMNDFMRRMEVLTMDEVEDDDGVVDQPWRDLE